MTSAPPTTLPGPHQQVRARSFRLQNRGAVPVAREQREFYFEPVVETVGADLAPAPGHSAARATNLSLEDNNTSQVGWFRT